MRRTCRRPSEGERRRFAELQKRRDSHAASLGIDPTLIASRGMLSDLAHDWDLGDIRIRSGSGQPAIDLFSPDGRSIGHWEGFVAPAVLGRALRGSLGVPNPFAASANAEK